MEQDGGNKRESENYPFIRINYDLFILPSLVAIVIWIFYFLLVFLSVIFLWCYAFCSFGEKNIFILQLEIITSIYTILIWLQSYM